MRAPDEQVLRRPEFNRALHPAPSLSKPQSTPRNPPPAREPSRTARALAGARSLRPVEALHKSWLAFRRGPLERPRLLGELLIVLVLLRVYDFIRTRGSLRRGSALEHGKEILDLESKMRIQVESRANRWAAAHHDLSLVASWFYQYAHITLTLSMLAWVWWRRPAHYRRARNSLVLINVSALLVFFLYPVAPPRLLGGHHGFVDLVALAGFGETHGGPVTADQYGAMPSLHIGWALWTALIGYRLVRNRILRVAWLGYPLVTCTVIVVTGNHYVLDAVAGAALALGAQWLTHFRRRRNATAAAESSRVVGAEAGSARAT